MNSVTRYKNFCSRPSSSAEGIFITTFVPLIMNDAKNATVVRMTGLQICCCAYSGRIGVLKAMLRFVLVDPNQVVLLPEVRPS